MKGLGVEDETHVGQESTFSKAHILEKALGATGKPWNLWPEVPTSMCRVPSSLNQGFQCGI